MDQLPLIDTLAMALRRMLVRPGDEAWYDGIEGDAAEEAADALAEYDAITPDRGGR